MIINKFIALVSIAIHISQSSESDEFLLNNRPLNSRADIAL